SECRARNVERRIARERPDQGASKGRFSRPKIAFECQRVARLQKKSYFFGKTRNVILGQIGEQERACHGARIYAARPPCASGLMLSPEINGRSGIRTVTRVPR